MPVSQACVRLPKETTLSTSDHMGEKKKLDCGWLLCDKLSFYTYHGVAVHPIIMPW